MLSMLFLEEDIFHMWFSPTFLCLRAAKTGAIKTLEIKRRKRFGKIYDKIPQKGQEARFEFSMVAMLTLHNNSATQSQVHCVLHTVQDLEWVSND